jgi:hypothetical protein
VGDHLLNSTNTNRLQYSFLYLGRKIMLNRSRRSEYALLLTAGNAAIAPFGRLNIWNVTLNSEVYSYTDR